MNKLKTVLVISLLLSASVMVLVNNESNVEASGGGGGEGEEDDGLLDFNYIWNITEQLCNVVYDAYNDTDIPRGRYFGSKGANYTVNNILIKEMNNSIGSENVTKLSIGHIETEEYWKDWEYTSNIWVNDFQIKINNDNYPLSNKIPKKEHFLIPAGRNNQTPTILDGIPTFNNSFNNIKIKPSNITGYWPFGGLYNNYSYTITNYDEITNSGAIILGNLTFISEMESVPSEEKQIERIFLLNESDYCQGQLDNLTNASGCLIIDTGADGVNLNTASCTYPVVNINEGNGTDIFNILKNYSDVLVDNVTGNLTLTYNFSDTGCLSSSDYIIIDRIPNHHELANGTGFPKGLIRFYRRLVKKNLNPPYDFLDYIGCWKLKSNVYWRINKINQRLNNLGANLPICKGIILYSSFEHHWMFHAWYNFQNNEYKLTQGNILNITSDRVFRIETPRVQTFTMNYTVGSFLVDNRGCTTLSGYGNQSLLKETPDKPAVEAYNVIGNITIDQSPNDAIAILSNRIDGWWGQTPGDSGIGGAIILGIAKYFKDYDIKPKYNLTFLFTTGEEIGCRGAWHYNHSHINDNIIFYLGLDQLGMAQNDQVLQVVCSNPNHQNILNETVNQSEYKKRTGYENETEHSVGIGTEMIVFSGRENCDGFMFVKGALQTWDHWHRTGLNYTEGDSLDRMDQNDVNITTELYWNITKYFIVNPNCWIPSTICLIKSDSDDNDDLDDTIFVGFDVKSTLPHDRVWINSTLVSVDSGKAVMYDNQSFIASRTEVSKNVSYTLPENESPGYYYVKTEIYNSTGIIDEIINPENDNVNVTLTTGNIFLYPYNYSLDPPVITNISASPDPVGYGGSVTISADVTSNNSSIDSVKVYIYKPDYDPEGTPPIYTMSNTVGDTYEYTFNDTWQHGQYNYSIWAEDANDNETGSSQHSFNVSAQGTVSVCTIKDDYGNNTWVNITDPPSSPPQVGYELLDDGDVLHIWNKYDSYYFDTTSGIQLTNHYDEYWSHNVLMLGYYSNDEWNLIYRTDELSGFNKDISSGETYVNATLWKDLTYNGYGFRLAIRHHLGVDDNELTIIPYIKNIDDEDIPYILGFGWEIKDIQIDMTMENDYIEINGTSYYLNQTLEETYTNLDDACFYIREDHAGDSSESLYLRWDEELNYKVKVKSREGQYNAPVTLGIKIGTLDVGQEKQTSLYWHDASEITYYFNSYDNSEGWATSPGYMVDGRTSNYASTTTDGDIELCDDNNCSGDDIGTISKVELRVYAYSTGLIQADMFIRPVFDGATDGPNHPYQTPPTPLWSHWFDITSDTNAPDSWTWTNVSNLDCDIESEYAPGGPGFTLYCSKVEIRVTYTSNNPPEISNPYPADNSTGITISPTLNITVSDPNGNNMNITWLSNSSGSWVVFGTNNSVGNGTYHQTMTNASVNGQWWYWKVNVSDGTTTIQSSVYKFYTGCESKIENTGSTNFSGYLLMQVQFFDTVLEDWFLVHERINETTPRTILVGGELGLDTIFNPGVETQNLLSERGNGTYRVYACFRDPDGDVLVCDDETLMEDTYEFTVTDT